MRRQPRQHMMRILPDGFGDNERRGRIDRLKDFNPLPLRGNESVTLIRFVGMGPH